MTIAIEDLLPLLQFNSVQVQIQIQIQTDD